MLEFLKTILGDGYSEEIDKKISAEVGRAFVSRTDFNAANESRKQLEKTVSERDRQLDELKKSAGTLDELKLQINTLQAENLENARKYADEIKRIKNRRRRGESLNGGGSQKR